MLHNTTSPNIYCGRSIAGRRLISEADYLVNRPRPGGWPGLIGLAFKSHRGKARRNVRFRSTLAGELFDANIARRVELMASRFLPGRSGRGALPPYWGEQEGERRVRYDPFAKASRKGRFLRVWNIAKAPLGRRLVELSPIDQPTARPLTLEKSRRLRGSLSAGDKGEPDNSSPTWSANSSGSCRRSLRTGPLSTRPPPFSR